MATLYHVLNRGVEKRDIVRDELDRTRFVHDLYIFNNENDVDPNHRFASSAKGSRTRDILVHIHAWCLMRNHYHLLVSPLHDDQKNLSLFMKKLNMGYAKYFNEKYERSGYLWQGKYRKILIKRDSHFLHIPYYIHLNPLDYIFPKWRSGAIQKTERVLKYLCEYRWSSFLDYYGERNFPSIITTHLLEDILSSRNKQKRMIEDIVSNQKIAEKSTRLE